MYGVTMLNDYQKKMNERYFRQVLSLTAENGIYAYPDVSETYTVKGGDFYGTERGVKVMKEITPKTFHKHIKLKEDTND